MLFQNQQFSVSFGWSGDRVGFRQYITCLNPVTGEICRIVRHVEMLSKVVSTDITDQFISSWH